MLAGPSLAAVVSAGVQPARLADAPHGDVRRTFARRAPAHAGTLVVGPAKVPLMDVVGGQGVYRPPFP